MFFHNGLNNCYHFTIKELAKEFEGKFNCVGENIEKYKPFPFSITKKVKRTDKNGEDATKNIIQNTVN